MEVVQAVADVVELISLNQDLSVRHIGADLVEVNLVVTYQWDLEIWTSCNESRYAEESHLPAPTSSLLNLIGFVRFKWVGTVL